MSFEISQFENTCFWLNYLIVTKWKCKGDATNEVEKNNVISGTTFNLMNAFYRLWISYDFKRREGQLKR